MFSTLVKVYRLDGGQGREWIFSPNKTDLLFEVLAISENPTMLGMRKSKDLKLGSFLCRKGPGTWGDNVLHHGGSLPYGLGQNFHIAAPLLNFIILISYTLSSGSRPAPSIVGFLKC